MLLIRPWITMNRGRFAPMHIAFFIFVVSNIGGALLPVGPPLFLGLLKGVPFWWTLQHCWRQWLVAVGLVLTYGYRPFRWLMRGYTDFIRGTPVLVLVLAWRVTARSS